MSLVMTSLVRRHMKHASAFMFRSEEHAAPLTFDAGKEIVVGWYENPKPWERTRIIFTDGAIYVCEATTQRRIGFDDIVEYELPASKTDSTGSASAPRTDFSSSA